MAEGSSEERVAELVTRAKKSEEEEAQSAIRDDGTINWECPCIQREVIGPCGVDFRAAFSAYVSMRNEGSSKPTSDFLDAVKSLKTCSDKHPEYYNTGGKDNGDDDDDDDNGFVDEDENDDVSKLVETETDTENTTKQEDQNQSSSSDKS